MTQRLVTGGLRMQIHILHSLHVAQVLGHLRRTQLPPTCSIAYRRCLSTTIGVLASNIGTCPADAPSTVVVEVKPKISRYSPKAAKKAGASEFVKRKKRLKVTSGEPCGRHKTHWPQRSCVIHHQLTRFTAITATTSKSTQRSKRASITAPPLDFKPTMASSHTHASPSPYTNYAIVSSFRKLPYKTKTLTRTDQLALAPFFDLEPFFAQTGRRKWDIYHDTDGNGKSILLVTLKQAWAYLDHVHHQTGIEVPRHPKSTYCYRKRDLKPGETVKEPVKVATVGNKVQWEEITAQWANGTTGRGGEGGMTAEEKEAKKKKQKERQERSKREFGLQVERARRLLRLSAAEEQVEMVTSTTTTTSNSKHKEEFEDVPFFVCVDCESWERNHSAVTEVGIAALDMDALPPSQQPTYETILPLMTYRHIRITEHRNLRNGRFVPDAADLFDFGTTEFQALRVLPTTLAEVFTPPPLSSHTTPEGKKRRRVIVFVGHDAGTDIRYLYDCKFDSRVAVRETLQRLDSQAGYEASAAREMDVFDTAEMYRAITGETNTKGLGKMLVELELQPWNLHNAGNDAAYTLRAFVKMCDRLMEGPEGKEEDAGPSGSPKEEADGGVKV